VYADVWAVPAEAVDEVGWHCDGGLKSRVADSWEFGEEEKDRVLCTSSVVQINKIDA
jgi:hypothetical protein